MSKTRVDDRSILDPKEKWLNTFMLIIGLSSGRLKGLKKARKSHKAYDKSKRSLEQELQARFLLSAGNLEVPDDVDLTPRTPGVKAQFTKATEVWHTHPMDGMSGETVVKKGDTCILHELTRGPYVYVEIATFGDTLTVLSKGWVNPKHVAPIQTYQKEKGPLFPTEPSTSDVMQGKVGDCYFLAAVMSVVDQHPDYIRDMMKDNGDGTVTVRLYEAVMDEEGVFGTERAMVARYVTVHKSRLESKSGNVERNETALWPHILEQAYAIFVGDRNKSKSGSLVGIAGGEGSAALQALTGLRSTQRTVVRSKTVFAEVITPVGLDTPALLFDDNNREEAIAAVVKLGVSREHATMLVVAVTGQTSPELPKLIAAVNPTGLFDQSGQLIGYEPVIWRGSILKAIQGVAANPLATQVEQFMQSEIYTTFRKKSSVRVDDLDELYDSEDFLKLDPVVQQRIKDRLAGKLPGKRFTGQYVESDLELYNDIAEGLANGKLMTIGTPKEKMGQVVGPGGKSAGESTSRGLAGGHEYAVLGVYEPKKGEPYYVEPKDGGLPIRYLRIRNPWGEGDPLNQNAQNGRLYVPTKDDDGVIKLSPKGSHIPEFLIELSDVTKRFETVSQTRSAQPKVSLDDEETLFKAVEQLHRRMVRAWKKAKRNKEDTSTLVDPSDVDLDELMERVIDRARAKGLEAAVRLAASELGRDPERSVQQVTDPDGKKRRFARTVRRLAKESDVPVDVEVLVSGALDMAQKLSEQEALIWVGEQLQAEVEEESEILELQELTLVSPSTFIDLDGTPLAYERTFAEALLEAIDEAERDDEALADHFCDPDQNDPYGTFPSDQDSLLGRAIMGVWAPPGVTDWREAEINRLARENPEQWLQEQREARLQFLTEVKQRVENALK